MIDIEVYLSVTNRRLMHVSPNVIETFDMWHNNLDVKLFQVDHYVTHATLWYLVRIIAFRKKTLKNGLLQI